MDCQDFLYQANTLIDGELSPAEAAALNAHLGECESCARICAELKYVKRLVQEKVERPVPPPQLLKRLAEGQGHEERVRVSAGFSGRRKVLLAAAALLVGLLALLLGLGDGNQRLSHATASAGCVDVFQRTLAESRFLEVPETTTIGQADAWRTQLRTEVARELGVSIDQLPSLARTMFLRWRVELVRGVKTVRVDFRATGPAEGDQASAVGGPGAAETGMGPRLISVFVVPMRKMDLTRSDLEQLKGLHCCTDCVSMTGGNIFCFSDKDVLYSVVGNLGADELRERLGNPPVQAIGG